MVYQERDEKDMDLNEQNRLYEEELYGDYGFSDTFGERVENTPMNEEDMAEDEFLMDDTLDDTTPDTRSQDTFGETLNSETNPHLDEAEQTNASDKKEDESLMDKAKDKLDEWTDRTNK